PPKPVEIETRQESTEIIVQEETTLETVEETDSEAIANESKEATEIEETTEETEVTEDDLRRQKLAEGDRLYLAGQYTEAARLYREAKEPFDKEIEAEVIERLAAYSDPDQLPPAGAVYWRQSGQGLEQQLESKIFVPLQFLVEQHPEFIPGHIRYAEALKQYERHEEAAQVLEKATTLYPNEPELIRAQIDTLAEQKKWLDASLAARQFAMMNPDSPDAEEFTQLAEQNMERYQGHLRSELRGNTIANIITGALGYALTGSLFGPISAVESTALLLQGESAVGDRISNQAQQQLPMLEDEEVQAYVEEIGNKIIAATGRDFDYEFYIIMDDRLNAFALPGGKVFINAGAILKTNSEAELAGLIAHEISHAVLSHGFQLVTEGNLIANVTQYIPYGGTAANLIVLNYSRDMERQADELGTRLLAASGYAADGLRNLSVTLEKENKSSPPAWLSTHPDTGERIRNMEKQIIRNGYNRYAYEGVERHTEIQEKVTQLWEEYKESEEYRIREERQQRRRR
ncbi:MAG: M48 family metalloprotease, partial [Chroococcales cyanobacterium]